MTDRLSSMSSRLVAAVVLASLLAWAGGLDFAAHWAVQHASPVAATEQPGIPAGSKDAPQQPTSVPAHHCAVCHLLLHATATPAPALATVVQLLPIAQDLPLDRLVAPALPTTHLPAPRGPPALA